jgi:hypothetical protein
MNPIYCLFFFFQTEGELSDNRALSVLWSIFSDTEVQGVQFEETAWGKGDQCGWDADISDE